MSAVVGVRLLPGVDSPAIAGALAVSGFVAVAGSVVIVSPAAWAIPPIVLNDAASTYGLVATHSPDHLCIGSQWHQTGGIGVGDFNNDGWPDVFVIGGGLAPDKLFINNRNGSFVDQAQAWGVAALHGGNGVAVGDYDNDGWLDIYVTSFGPAGVLGQPGRHKLYRNNGNNTFTDVAIAAGVNQTTVGYANGYGACWGDYNLDGKLDLFVASWKDTIGPGNNGTGNRLFKNNGDGTFTDVTASLGSALVGVWGFQPAFVDMDGDRIPELLIAADFTTSKYLQNGGNGTFFDMTSSCGVGIDNNGMGQTVADFNRDGMLDWYVTSIYSDTPRPNVHNGDTLYMAQGPLFFVESAAAAGCVDGGWGWGTVAVDLDQDGWPDIIEVNGRQGGLEWQNEREYLWHNDGDGTFTEIGAAAGLGMAGEGRGLAVLDADNDGDMDFLIVDNSNALRYFRNVTSTAGRWLNVTLKTTNNPTLAPDGFGARVTAVVGRTRIVRYQNGSPSYLSTSDLRLHFGLGSASVVDQLIVDWPRGQTTTLNNVQSGTFITIDAPRPADITADGVVNIDDLFEVINNWGTCPTPSCAADVNASGAVNVDDLFAVINNWG